MSTTHKGSDSYVEDRDGVLYVRDSRVPVESLVWLWRDGYSAEGMQEEYPTLPLAAVYGAIVYYLTHRAELDRQVAEGVAAFGAQRAVGSPTATPGAGNGKESGKP